MKRDNAGSGPGIMPGTKGAALNIAAGPALILIVTPGIISHWCRGVSSGRVSELRRPC